VSGWSAAFQRGRARLGRWSQPPLRRALERVSRRTVIVTEFPATPSHRWGWDLPPHGELSARFAASRDGYRGLLEGFERHLPELRAIQRTSDSVREPAWYNDYFAGLDAVALYAFVADRRPKRYLEIGSGFSTRFAHRAIKDSGTGTRITSIDPSPRAEVEQLCDEVYRVGLQQVPSDAFEDLESGDVVLVDGSHVAHMGSDAVVFFTEVLPALPVGVLVGIDDVFLPWDYPPTWVGRWYAEQYLLAVLLLSGGPSWNVVFPAWWVTHDAALASTVNVFSDPANSTIGTVGMTLWMERVDGSRRLSG
jgi:hypothetical protein